MPVYFPPVGGGGGGLTKGGTFTLFNNTTWTLPSAVGYSGAPYVIINGDSGATIVTSAGGTVNGAVYVQLSGLNTQLSFTSDGTNWVGV